MSTASPSNRLVVVAGATGQQGGAAARALLARGYRVRGLTRDPGSAKARALAAAGAEVVAGDLGDASAIAAAAAGADAMFSVTSFFGAGVAAEVAQGLAQIDAARRAGVRHFVFTSVASADKRTGIPHFDSKARIEEALAGSGLGWTVLAPVYFMENLRFPQTFDGLRGGVYAAPLSPSRLLQQVAVRDIGEMAAVAVERGLTGRRIELAGDNLDGEGIARALTAAIGRPIRYQAFPAEAIRATSEDLYLMYKYFEDVGYDVDIAGLRREFPEVGWRTFAAWLAESGEMLAPLR